MDNSDGASLGGRQYGRGHLSPVQLSSSDDSDDDQELDVDLSRDAFLHTVTAKDPNALAVFLEHRVDLNAPDLDARAEMIDRRLEFLIGMYQRDSLWHSVLFEPRVLDQVVALGLPFPRRPTPLQLAAKNGWWYGVKKLCEAGCELGLRDDRGWSALMYATREDYLDIVRYLDERGSPVDAANDRGWSPLMIATINGYLPIVEYLIGRQVPLNATSHDGKSSVIIAIEKHRTDILRELLRHGADPNIRCSTQWSPLMKAAYRGYNDCVQLLLQAGVNADEGDLQDGWTPLMLATPHRDVVETLLAHGSDPNHRNCHGKTAIVVATRQSNVEAMRLLAEAGAILEDGAEISCANIAVQADQHEALTVLQELINGRCEAEKKNFYSSVEEATCIKQKLGEATAAGLCTYRVTKDTFYYQKWFRCFTCAPDDRTVGVCSVCATCCHEGHVLEAQTLSSFFCDCGHGHFGGHTSCNALVTRPKQRQIEQEQEQEEPRI